jgi:adenosine deaminase
MDYLAEEEVGLEVCLTSNVQTSSVSSLASHPAQHILRHGVKMNLNTDDPGISGIDLRHEYEFAAPLAGLSHQMIRTAQANALAMAFLDDNEKKDLLARKRMVSESAKTE